MNSEKTKAFSSANLVMCLSGFTLFITYFFLTIDTLRVLPYLTFPIFILSIFLFSTLFLIKFPVFVKDNETYTNEAYCDNKYVENVNFFKRLYFSLFSSEPSQIMSFFSGLKLILFNKDRVCKFAWENEPVKPVHRILDLLMAIPLITIAFLLGLGLSTGNFYFSLALCIIFVIVMFRNKIISYSLSIKVGNIDGCNLKVIYPYRKKPLTFIKHYGMSFPFSKTILVSDEVFNSSSTSLKDYVISHELGHINDKRRIAFIISIAMFFIIYLTVGPYVIFKLGFKHLIVLPILTFLLYWSAFGFNLKEKAELFADEYAVKRIGKERCLAALEIIKNESSGDTSGYAKFFKPIPISTRIRFINEYSEKR